MSFYKNHLRHAITPLFVGVGAASFWRGAWYILDDNLFPSNPFYSSVSSFGLGIVSTLIFQPLITFEKNHKSPLESAFLISKISSSIMGADSQRFKALLLSYPRVQQMKTILGIYGLAWSCVLLWRGTWMGWDLFYEYYMTFDLEDILLQQKNQILLNPVKNESIILRLVEEERMDRMIEGFISTWKIIQQADLVKKKKDERVGGIENEPIKEEPIMIHHGTQSGLLSHVTAVFFLSTFGILASVFAPPARIAVLQDTRFTFKKWWR